MDPPTVSVSKRVNPLKGAFSRMNRKTNDMSIRQKLLRGAPVAVIREYIEQQLTPHYSQRQGRLCHPRACPPLKGEVCRTTDQIMILKDDICRAAFECLFAEAKASVKRIWSRCRTV